VLCSLELSLAFRFSIALWDIALQTCAAALPFSIVLGALLCIITLQHCSSALYCTSAFHLIIAQKTLRKRNALSKFV
jgi:hypothetical protein